MNKIFLIGNLTKDPEIRMTSSGKKVASFAIAVNDGKDANGQEIVQYFNLSAWEKKADLVESYVKKGHKIAIFGRLQNRSWDKPDGSKGYATDVVVTDIELLTSRNESERLATHATQNPETPATVTPKSVPNNQNLPEINIDEMDISSQMPF